MGITLGGTRRQSHNKLPHLLALKNPSASPSSMFSEPEVEECFVALCSTSLLLIGCNYLKQPSLDAKKSFLNEM